VQPDSEKRFSSALALLPGHHLTFQSALELLAALALLLVLSGGAWLFLRTEVLSITFPYPLDYGEAPLVDQAMRLLAGESLYHPTLDAAPYTISNYPPLYVVVIAPFVALWGPNFWGGRLLSTLSALAAGIFLALIVYRLRRDALAALITAGLFWAFPFVVHWSGLLRITFWRSLLAWVGFTPSCVRLKGGRACSPVLPCLLQLRILANLTRLRRLSRHLSGCGLSVDRAALSR